WGRHAIAAALPMSEMVVQPSPLLHPTQVGAPDAMVERTHTSAYCRMCRFLAGCRLGPGLRLHYWAKPAKRGEGLFHPLIRVTAMPDENSTVLVIDDDPSLRASVGRLLRSLGIDVQLFASIADFLRSNPPRGPT